MNKKNSMTPTAPHRLLILACSGTKTAHEGRIPAIDRYTGPLWQTLRAADPDGTRAQVAFLSARFGLRRACTPIENYNERMTPATAAEMIAGGLIKRWPKDPPGNRGLPYGCHAGAELCGFTEYGRYPFTEVAIVGGHLYLDVMRALVPLFQENASSMCKPDIRRNAQVVEINGSIGLMRQSLRRWLEATPVQLSLVA